MTAGNPHQPILIIENSDEDFATLKKMMQKSSLVNPIYRCIDGKDALDFLYRCGTYSDPQIAPRPAIILLNLNLPAIDAQEVLQKIKSDPSLKTIPVVAIATSTNPQDIQACYQNGANGCIVKPADAHKLAAKMQIFVNCWFKTVVLPDAV